MLSPRSPRREAGDAWVVAGVFTLALALRIVAIVQLHGSGLWDYLRLDPLYYHDWGLRIAHGEILGEGTYEMTPLYAYGLGGLFALFGPGLLAPRLLQALLGSLTCAVTALLGCRIFARTEGILAGLTMAAYGPALFHETQIMKTVLTMALSTATAAALYFSRGAHAGALAAAGLLLGLTALAQENINVILPFLLVWIARMAPPGRRIACGAALLSAYLVAVAPATLRNYIVSGDLVLITTGGGEVFYTGNNELASGKYSPPAFVRPDPFFEHEDFRSEAARRLGVPPGSVSRKASDAFWWKEGLRFITGNPGAYVVLLWDKLATYFTDYERPDNYAYDNFAAFLPVLRLPLPRFGWVAPFALLGMALVARRWLELLPLYLTMGAYLLSALLFFTQSRYRMPMIPLFCLFAAHAASWLAHATMARRLASLSWSVPVLVALAVFVNRDPGNSPGFEAQHRGILGEMYLHAGRSREAADQFRSTLAMLQALPAGPNGQQHARMVSSAHFGIVLAAEGPAPAPASEEEIVQHLIAAARSPDADLRRDAAERLGSRLLKRGDAAGAAAALAEAVQAAPQDPGLLLRLAEALHKAGRPTEALAAADAAIAAAGDSRPLLASAHYGKALIYLKDIPDPGLAAHHLREVLRLDPSHARAAWIRERLATLGPPSEERSP